MPPGYVHEDIIEFVLPIIKRAYYAEHGLDFDGQPDPDSDIHSKAMGKQNTKDALDLILPILEGDAALQARVTDYMRDLLP